MNLSTIELMEQAKQEATEFLDSEIRAEDLEDKYRIIRSHMYNIMEEEGYIVVGGEEGYPIKMCFGAMTMRKCKMLNDIVTGMKH
jgi:hypothetical protein